MKKYLPIFMIALFLTKPALTMELEPEDIRIFKKHTISFSHNSFESGLGDYILRKIKEKTIGYEDEKEKESIARFINSQKNSGTKIVLELCDATLDQLKYILSLCKNVVGLRLTNTPYWQSDIYPDDRYIKAIIHSKNLKTLEYFYIQEWEKILDYTYLDMMDAHTLYNTLPSLKYFYCLSTRDSSAAAFYKAPTLIHIGPIATIKSKKEKITISYTTKIRPSGKKEIVKSEKIDDIKFRTIKSIKNNEIVDKHYTGEAYRNQSSPPSGSEISEG